MTETTETTETIGATDTGQFVIERVFDAPLSLVWAANTQSRHLTHWWGPKGLTIIACTMDATPGGTFHYGFSIPGGGEMWGKWRILDVVPETSMKVIVAFSDEAGGMTRHPFAPNWPLETLSTSTFIAEGGRTRLRLTAEAHDASAAERQTFAEGLASMEAGYGGTLDSLDAYLAKLQASETNTG